MANARENEFLSSDSENIVKIYTCILAISKEMQWICCFGILFLGMYLFPLKLVLCS